MQYSRFLIAGRTYLPQITRPNCTSLLLPVTNAGAVLVAGLLEPRVQGREAVGDVLQHPTELRPTHRLTLQEGEQRAVIGI